MAPLPDQLRLSARRASRAALALSGVAYALVVLGALVRAHGAGLACPDWPLCFGVLVPQFDFQVALEWGHRALAGSLSLGLAGLSFYAARTGVLRLAAPWFAGLWILLAVQVVLGGLTVLLGLAPWTVTAHLVCGNGFALGLAWLALALRRAARLERAPAAPLPDASPRILAAATALAVVVQLVLGGLVASRYAGLACPAFPTCDGVSFAPTLEGQVGLQVLHRANALLLAGLIVGLAWRLRGAGAAGRWAVGAALAVLAQIVVGAVNVLWQVPVEVTALHSALAAGITLAAFRVLGECWGWRLGERAPALPGAQGQPRASVAAPELRASAGGRP